jgi:putative ABC transport system permease protein
MQTMLSRLLDLVLRRQREDRLSEETQTHLDLLTDEHIARGMTPADARLAALKSFGGVDQIKEVYRDQRGFPLADGLIQDTRYAVRMIARDRWFTAAVVIALALGIGVSSTMLTLIYSMNFRGLPFHDAAALVGVGGEPARGLGARVPFAVFDAWRSAARSFSGMSAEADAVINLGDDTNATDQFAGTFISHNGFAMLGESPMLGRDFTADDDRAGAAPVVIIGHRIWTDRYGSDPNVIGRTVRVNGQPATVVGVMPEGFKYPIDHQVWRPLAALPEMATPDAGQRPLRIVARLADGVSIEQGRAELGAIVSTLATVTEADRTRRTVVMPLNETYFGKATQPVPMMLLAAVLVVLLMACSHAASLLIARSTMRTREISMRAALGASRARIVRALLVESVLLALMAGMLGVAMTSFLVRAFANEVSGFGMPYWTRFGFDPQLVSYIAVLCMGTGVACGLVPALRLSKTNVADMLNQGGRSGMASPRAQRLTSALLVGELALTVILLASAGVLVQSAAGVYRADQAIDLLNLWEFRVALPQPQYASSERRLAFYRALDERLAAAPGLESAALAGSAPFIARDSRGILMENDIAPGDRSSDLPSAGLVAIGDRYFDTLGLKVIRGVRLEDVDAATRSSSALVNQRFADRFSPGVDAIGRQVRLVNERTPEAPPERFTIVGIAPPLRQQIATGHTPVVYVPHATQPAAVASLIVRGRPERFADVLRQEIRRIDPDLPLFNLQSLERVSYLSRWIQRITSTAMSIVAIIATILAALGLYSLTAYAAAQRTQEIGVRMALGARRSQVSWLFMRRTLRQLSAGLVIGLAGAVAVGTVLQGALVEVRAANPLTLAGVCALLVTVAIAATLLPVRKASRLDPVAALRQE